MVQRPDTSASNGLTLAVSTAIEIPSTSLLVGHWCDEHGVTFARARAEGPDRWIDWPGVGVFAFRLGSSVVRVAPRRPFDQVRDLFIRVLQPVVQQALGRQALHASAVRGRGGVLAFCGRGRSGKSTLAYALSGRGFDQVADDALLIESIADDISVRPLPFVPQLREPSRHHFGVSLPSSISGPLNPDRPLDLVAPLRAVFVLEQRETATAPVAERLAPVSAFSVLLRHAHCFDQRPTIESAPLVEDYLRIVERVPVFALTYAPSFDGLETLAAVVEAIGATVAVSPWRREKQAAGA